MAHYDLDPATDVGISYTVSLRVDEGEAMSGRADSLGLTPTPSRHAQTLRRAKPYCQFDPGVLGPLPDIA